MTERQRDRHSPPVELVTFRETKPVTELEYKAAEVRYRLLIIMLKSREYNSVLFD